MNQITPCDWLPEQASWSYLARSGLPGISHKKNFPKRHIINPLLTKLELGQGGWILASFFFASLWTWTTSRFINTEKYKELGQYPAILTELLR